MLRQGVANLGLELVSEEKLRATITKQYKCILQWTAEKHYVPGTYIELRCGSLRSLVEWSFVKSEIEHADISFRWKVAPSISEIVGNRNTRILCRGKLAYGLRKGQSCRIELWLIPSMFAGVHLGLSIWTGADKEGTFSKDATSECTIPVYAGNVHRLSVYSHPMSGIHGEVRTCIVPEDRFGNPTAFEQPAKLQLHWRGQTWETEVVQTTVLPLSAPDKVERLNVLIPPESLSVTENIANGVPHGDLIRITGNPVWPKSNDGLLAAFGEFHWHTELSVDGQRSVVDGLEAARDELNMNFAASSDHSTKGDHWSKTVEALNQFNKPDEFATFFGWENSTAQGHENYYFTDADHPLVCGGKAGFTGGVPDRITEQLSAYSHYFAVPHHTNSISESRRLEDDTPYWYPYNWSTPVEYIRLVEIMQTRGNQERNEYEDEWRGWHQHCQSSVQDALALGYKIGFTGGTDNHCSWPGRAFAIQEGGARHDVKSVILTGIWTRRMERQEVYDALWNRHTWAVWDTRAIVWFTVNETLMGGEMSVAHGAPLQAEIRMSAEDSLQIVEIISEQRTVWASSFKDSDVHVKVSLGRAKASTHFYMRALQRNGGIIYASPVFINV